MLVAERAAPGWWHRARRSTAALLIEKLQYTIRKMRHERFGQSSERGTLLDQLELQLADLEEDAAQADAMAGLAAAVEKTTVPSFERRDRHAGLCPSMRERIVYPLPASCPCCGGGMLQDRRGCDRDAGIVPRRWKVIQHVREVLLPLVRSHYAATGPTAPDRARAGRAKLLAHILFSKYGLHLPLTRQSAVYGRKASISTYRRSPTGGGIGGHVDATGRDDPGAHVFAAERIHADDTTVPVLAKGKTRTGRLWTYVRDDRPFAGPAPPA
ncbi:MAG: transposase [Steroidobacteraceae bacterium]